MLTKVMARNLGRCNIRLMLYARPLLKTQTYTRAEKEERVNETNPLEELLKKMK